MSQAKSLLYYKTIRYCQYLGFDKPYLTTMSLCVLVPSSVMIWQK